MVTMHGDTIFTDERIIIAQFEFALFVGSRARIRRAGAGFARVHGRDIGILTQ
jgi:hypothetical protein